MVPPVGEIVAVPVHAIVGELKQAMENALKDTYCITDEFVLMEISELRHESRVCLKAKENGHRKLFSYGTVQSESMIGFIPWCQVWATNGATLSGQTGIRSFVACCVD